MSWRAGRRTSFVVERLGLCDLMEGRDGVCGCCGADVS